MSNIIYVLTNPAYPNHVKIGKTDNLERRVKDLSRHSGVPEPFEVFYACEVVNASKVEKHILKALGDHRMNPKKEFLKIEPDKLVWILKLVEVKDVTPKDVSEKDDEINQIISSSSTDSKTRVEQKEKKNKPAFTFSSAKIPIGSTIRFDRDERITAVVHDDRKIKFKGKITSLSQSARDVLIKRFGWKKNRAVAGTWFWKYKNELLAERRLRFEKK